MKKLFFTYFFVFYYLFSYAQFGTKGELKDYYYDGNYNETFLIDTGLNNFEEYNFEQQEGWEYFNLGIIGSAEQTLNFSRDRRKGFKDGNVFFDNYKYDIHKIKRYDVTKYPYSELSYSIGSNIEQIAKLVHAQNIKNRFKFALEVYGMSAKSAYNETHRTRNAAISFYGDFSSKNNRYHLGADFSYSTIKTNESGGIIENVLTDIQETKLFYTTNIQNAITENNTLSLVLKNAYDFGFFRQDSVNDSLEIKKFYPTIRIKHSIGTNITRNKFYDLAPDTVFYNDFFQTKDSLVNKLAYHNIPHRITIEYLGTKNTDSVTYRNINAEIALQHNNLEIWQNGFEKTYNNLMLEAKLTSNHLSNSNLSYGLSSYYIFTGYNKSDFHLGLNAGYNMNKYGKISAKFIFESLRPSWIETYYFSKSEKWSNPDFENKRIMEGSLKYELSKYHLKFNANIDFLDQYIYFDNNSSPIQTNAKITYWNLSIQKDTKWKIWHWNNFIGYQFTNHQELLPLPNLFLKTSLYAEFSLFKRNLLLNAGFDLRYNTEFKAKAWNPVIAQFYIQDSQNMKYTPVVDVFVNMKIKTVRIYAKLNYANEGLFVQNYYKALNYPSNGRTFSFGGSWRFFE